MERSPLLGLELSSSSRGDSRPVLPFSDPYWAHINDRTRIFCISHRVLQPWKSWCWLDVVWYLIEKNLSGKIWEKVILCHYIFSKINALRLGIERHLINDFFCIVKELDKIYKMYESDHHCGLDMGPKRTELDRKLLSHYWRGGGVRRLQYPSTSWSWLVSKWEKGLGSNRAPFCPIDNCSYQMVKIQNWQLVVSK